ncbi:MAG: type II CAAX endopeptidase family protein [Chitinophagaceae bacterium]
MVNQQQDRTRTLLLSVGFVIVFLILLIGLSFFKNFLSSSLERYAHGICGIIAAVAATWIFLRIEKKSFSDIGLKWESKTFKRFLIGLAIGFAIAAIMIFSQVIYSGLKVEMAANYNIINFIIWSLALLPLAFMEEMAFRGYPFVKMNRSFGVWITQITIAVLFALYHIVNGWSVEGSFTGPGIWSLAFGLAALVSGGIAMPTGLHFGVNMILAAVGGKKDLPSILKIDFAGAASKEMVQDSERFGLILHFVLLIACLIATAWFARRKNAATVL